jgi:L-rhamnose mutarotase
VTERIGFVMRLRPGQEAAYRARHEAVWPELLADLKTAGARNYSIFLRDDDLFAYLEVDDFDAFTRSMTASAANERWQAEMEPLIDPLTDPSTGFHTRIPEVFHLE